MSRYELTRSALADIDELWTYIADDNIAAANRVSDAILDACALLAEQPLIGHTRQDLTPRPVLFWSTGRYLIVYRPDTEPLRVVAVFHAAGDVASLLIDRE
jgi:plasmid stabilization system protein ParE